MTNGISQRRAFTSSKITASFLAIWLLLFAAAPVLAQEQAKKLVALLDYLGSDYKNAVKDGKVLNPDEYGEMQEFAKRGLELFAQLKAADKGDKAGVEALVKSLAQQVTDKADPKAVAETAKATKEKLLAAYNIVPYPRRLPSMASGKKIYDDNCAQCHGATGKGDGPGRESMKPKTPLPANFTDPERIGGLSPFKVFNTASFGIEGTAMASFAALSEEQRWQVAFYVFSLRFTDEAAKTGAQMVKAKGLPGELQTVATLATSADEVLLDRLQQQTKDESQALAALAYLRRGMLEASLSDPLSVAKGLLREAVALYAKGEKDQAYQKAVEAYLDGYELAEPTLVAKDASLGRGLEAQFTQLRNSIKQGAPAEEIQKQHLEIEVQARSRHPGNGARRRLLGLLCLREFSLDHLSRRTRGGTDPGQHHRHVARHGRNRSDPLHSSRLDSRALLRRIDLGSDANRAHAQRPPPRKHGRIYFRLRRRGAVLCRLLAAYPLGGQTLA